MMKKTYVINDRNFMYAFEGEVESIYKNHIGNQITLFSFNHKHKIVSLQGKLRFFSSQL